MHVGFSPSSLIKLLPSLDWQSLPHMSSTSSFRCFCCLFWQCRCCLFWHVAQTSLVMPAEWCLCLVLLSPLCTCRSNKQVTVLAKAIAACAFGSLLRCVTWRRYPVSLTQLAWSQVSIGALQPHVAVLQHCIPASTQVPYTNCQRGNRCTYLSLM